MRNTFTTDVLGAEMLNLMMKYSQALKGDGYKLNATIMLLQHNPEFVKFFHNSRCKICSVDDLRVTRLL